MSKSDKDKILVYDSTSDGHRENYVNLMAKLIGGVPLIEPLDRAWGRLLSAQHLLMTTFDTEPKRFFPLLALRSLLGRKSAIISLRGHLMAVDPRPSARLMIQLLRRMPGLLPMSLVSFDERRNGRGFQAILDPEFWDVGPKDLLQRETDLSTRVRTFAAGKQTLLLLGNQDRHKGMEFLADIYRANPDLIQHMIPVICGRILPEVEHAARFLEDRGGFIEARYLEREEIMSLYRLVDAAWCCYPPERDLTSGIFGRALQFGVAPIVRSGSVLDALSGDVRNVVRLRYGDVTASGAALTTEARRLPAADTMADQAKADIRGYILDHFGIEQNEASL